MQNLLGGGATATATALKPVGATAAVRGAMLAMKTAAASTAVSAPGFTHVKAATALALVGASGQLGVSVTMAGELLGRSTLCWWWRSDRKQLPSA